MTAVHTEKEFEATIESRLVNDGGWSKLPADVYDRQRRVVPSEIVAFIKTTQPKAWEKLTRRHGEDRVEEAFVDRVVDQIDKRGTLDVLRHGVKDQNIKFQLAYFKPAHELTYELVERYRANRLAVIRQVPYSPEHHNTLDLLLLVNGLPVSTAELKNNLTDQGVDDAITQYRTDRDPSDVLLSRRALVHFAVDPYLVMMTTKLAGEDTAFLPFNRGGEDGGKGNPTNPDGYDTAYLWEQIWQRDNWLDILHRFLHIERDDPGSKRAPAANADDTVIFPRYHQWEAVRQLEDQVLDDGAGDNYLIMHSTGAGKTKTIAWLTHRLAQLHDAADEKIFDKIVVITDRVVLDSQLQDAIWQFDHERGVVANITGKGAASKSQQLTEALMSKTAKIIVVTQQTFPFVLEEARELEDHNYAIVIDEAHSGQTGETAKEVRAVMAAEGAGRDPLEAAIEADTEAPDAQDELIAAIEASAKARGKHDNLSMFAFTATPKPKTLEMFGTPTGERGESGQPIKAPFHLYSMRQAIEEGFILDVLANYVTYSTYYELESAGVDDDPEVDARKAASRIARWVALHPTNVGQKARIVVDHFRRHTRHKILGGKAKAMVVTSSRLHAVRYKNAIDDYIAEKGYDDVAALVAFSGEVTDPDLPAEGGANRFTEASMNDFPQSQTKAKFASDDYQVMVVAEKYQTGFDQPLLHTMFVDKTLTGVNAVQTLSRLNRTYPGKEDTFVLDFVNDAEQIRDAFAPFYEATLGEATDPNKLTDASEALDTFGVLDEEEMDAFAAAYLKLEPGVENVHEKLHAHLSGAKERFGKLEEDDQEAFRAQLKRFVNMYAFLSQVIDYTDTDMERRYLYGRFLTKVLPRDQDGSFDVPADLRLSALRTEQVGGTRDLSLDGGGGITTAFAGEGTGSSYQPKLAPLSEVIETLNHRFGTDFTEADRLKIESIGTHMAEDTELQHQATANPIEAFKHTFEDKFVKAVVERMDADEDLSTRLLDDEDFRDVVLAGLLPFVYRRSQQAAQA